MTRRIANLLKLQAEGKLQFARPEAAAGFFTDVELIRRRPDGSIDLSTCSPLVKSVANAAFAMERYELIDHPPASTTSAGTPDHTRASRAMIAYFEMLEDFFNEATGTTALAFDVEEFRSKVLGGDPRVLVAVNRAYEKYPPNIANFQAENTSLLYSTAKGLGGLKVVLGGSSRFVKPTFDAVRKMALYSDTILVPDPLLPWLEVDRVEERFPVIEFLTNAHQLLLLKPLVDARLPFPAVIVFPSWEKLFELNDMQTKDGIAQLILGFFSAYLDGTFEDESELIEYVQGRGQANFQETVTRNGLFWPPEAPGPLPFHEGVAKYRKWLEQRRSQEWLESMPSISHEGLVLKGIWERLTPHYHVRDNAAALHAQPMYWLSPHFHYYRLIASAANLLVRRSEIIAEPTFLALESLARPETAWLGNVPIADLARLREQNENEQFRSRLRSYMDELGAANLEDLETVSASVMRALESLLADHDREAKRLADDLERKLFRTLGGSVLTLAAAMYPWLAAWTSLAVLGPPIMAGTQIIDHLQQRRALSMSLIGVLSEAHSLKGTNQSG